MSTPCCWIYNVYKLIKIKNIIRINNRIKIRTRGWTTFKKILWLFHRMRNYFCSNTVCSLVGSIQNNFCSNTVCSLVGSIQNNFCSNTVCSLVGSIQNNFCSNTLQALLTKINLQKTCGGYVTWFFPKIFLLCATHISAWKNLPTQTSRSMIPCLRY